LHHTKSRPKKIECGRFEEQLRSQPANWQEIDSIRLNSLQQRFIFFETLLSFKTKIIFEDIRIKENNG